MERKQRTFRLEGEIDHRAAAALRQDMDRLIASERPTKLILDFRDVTMMDSSGVGLIIGRYKKLQKYGGNIYVSHVRRQIDAVLRVSGLYEIVRKQK